MCVFRVAPTVRCPVPPPHPSNPFDPPQDYLTDADFEALFKMPREKFASEPLWRQKHKKKALKLF